MPDDKTAGRQYPLPHPDNSLVTDAGRLRRALAAIDGDVSSVLRRVDEVEQKTEILDDMSETVQKVSAIPEGASEENPLALAKDIPEAQLSTDQMEAIPAGASAKNPLALKRDIPEPPEALPEDILAALEGANEPSEENPFATKADLPIIPAAKNLRMIDLQLPGKFAGAITNAALEASKDFAVWEIEQAVVKYIKARCAAADSGATPCSVQLVVNGVPVGSAVRAIASSWTVQAQTGVTLQTGDQVEIAVVDTGTNKDSEWLRFTVAVEV